MRAVLAGREGPGGCVEARILQVRNVLRGVQLTPVGADGTIKERRSEFRPSQAGSDE